MNPLLLSLALITTSLVAQVDPALPKVPREPSPYTKGRSEAADVYVAETPLQIAAATTVGAWQADGVELAAPTAPAASPAPAATALQRTVSFDRAGDGALWAYAPDWKASFDGVAATFVPFFGSDAPRNHPATFSVRQARLGGVPLRVPRGHATERAGTVSIARGDLVERYVTSPVGIEQQFVFAQLHGAGELAVTIDVHGDYEVTSTDGQHLLTCASGSIRYGAAVAIDGSGKRVGVQSEWTGDAIRLTVPEWFVAAASMPLVIDPLIGQVTALTASSSQTIAATDIAYDASLQTYLLCFERVFSQTDSDVFARRLDRDMNPFGSQITIDFTSTSWRGCHVAGLNLYDKFLVVAEVSGSAWPVPYVAGRIFDAGTSTLHPPIDIQKGAEACTNPDVGGDPYPNGPVYWTVVFEREYGSFDHDILMRQVQDDGTLRASTFTAIDTSLNYEYQPHISNSDGVDGPASTQRWCIVWRRSTSGGSSSVRCVTCSWDGVVDPVQVFSGSSPNQYTGDVTVSSPTRSSLGRNFLIAQRRHVLALGIDLVSTLVVAPNGVVVEPWTYSLGFYEHGQDPVAESDGRRFVIGFTPPFGSDDADQKVATLDLVAGSLEVRDVQWCAQSGDDELHMTLCSEVSGGASAAGERRYAIAWARDASSGDLVEGVRYAGVATNGGAAVRWTDCGLFAVNLPNSIDQGAIGAAIQMDWTVTVPLQGWAFGEPISVPMPGCSSCTLGTTATHLSIGGHVDVPVPFNPNLVGVTFALQPFRLVSGLTCIGGVELGDAIDVTIR